jgi:hypothetical protein
MLMIPHTFHAFLLSVGPNMMLLYCYFPSVFVLSCLCVCVCVCVYIYIYIYRERERERENVIAQPLVAVHVSVVMKPTHAQLYYFESSIVFCV